MDGGDLPYSSSAGPKPTGFGAFQKAAVVCAAIVKPDVISWINAEFFQPTEHIGLALTRVGDRLEIRGAKPRQAPQKLF
jgi:hypothetical protein